MNALPEEDFRYFSNSWDYIEFGVKICLGSQKFPKIRIDIFVFSFGPSLVE